LAATPFKNRASLRFTERSPAIFHTLRFAHYRHRSRAGTQPAPTVSLVFACMSQVDAHVLSRRQAAGKLRQAAVNLQAREDGKEIRIWT
jgi:hypothetical protein